MSRGGQGGVRLFPVGVEFEERGVRIRSTFWTDSAPAVGGGLGWVVWKSGLAVLLGLESGKFTLTLPRRTSQVLSQEVY
jgi:hypothetical protein